MWFERLTGFREQSPAQVRDNLHVEGNTLRSRVNGRSYVWGSLEMPSLAELRQRAGVGVADAGLSIVREVVADVRDLHAAPAANRALFQVASQFNLLEMATPEATPERGVDGYERDCTQGPACAVAAGAGLIYRNYFVPLDGDVGQSATHQIDCLADLGAALGNTDGQLWQMKNGYLLPTRDGLEDVSARIAFMYEAERDLLRRLLRIGLQWDTAVTLEGCSHTVSQAYCSALPVSYSDHPVGLWEPFARLILEAAYEATLCAAVVNGRRTGNRTVYMTLLGGGVFGNEMSWIVESLERAIRLFDHAGLDVVIVSPGFPRRVVQKLLRPVSGT